ncbi:MAG TPA: crotonase/enoyl-CoA hydratase family protein [Myxococcota bacterium]|nr:crotonase/enoyl-CoA hydratase family protein [Myxococcota bacterium]
MADEVLTEVRGRVLVITLNRPEARNALNNALSDALVETIARLDADDDLSLAVLTGAGKGFSAGMDLKAFASEGPPRNFGKFLQAGSKKPLIAAVEGFALAGGLEIALACDLIVAARDVRVGIPEAKRGLFAAGGALLRLPRRVGLGKAMELALTGDPIDAEEAHRLGIVDFVAESGHALEAALALADRIAKNAPLSLAMSKKLLREMQGRTEEEFWKMQAADTATVFASEDAREGAVAFAQKREPSWKGR